MARKSTLVWRLAVLALITGAIPLALHTYESRGQVRTQPMLDASVSIRTVSHVRIDRFGDSVWETGSGSGFVVSKENCEIWTNHHVVADAAIIEVFPSHWRGTTGIAAKVVNSTPRSDIAILRMETCPELPQATLGDSDLVRPGDVTYAVGNPLGHNPDSISRGIISHTRRIASGGIAYLQTDAAINPGNSGGALFNRQGEVIGINAAIARTRSGANVGVGFAIPINTAKQIVAELRQGPPSWGDAGIGDIVSELAPDEATVFNVPDGHAALVLNTTPDKGPGAGRLHVRDVIFRIDGDRFNDSTEAMQLFSRHRPGDEVSLEIVRNAEVQEVAITLQEGWSNDETPSADPYEGLLGLTLEMWNDDTEGERMRFDTPVITKVHSLGPAHKARIASSQNTVLMRGPVIVPYVIDVKTITGVALDGAYHEISSIDDIARLSNLAFYAKLPLLLEIELWARTDRRNPATQLERQGTAYFKVLPEPALVPDHPLLVVANQPLVDLHHP